MTVVVDASVVVSALLEDGPTGAWAESILESTPLVAPAILPAETANILRRASLVGQVSEEVASQAHLDLLDLAVELFPYEPLGTRVWELRHTVTAYDGWYVALAERLELPLATLDRRLRRAPGTKCAFEMPDPE